MNTWGISKALYSEPDAKNFPSHRNPARQILYGIPERLQRTLITPKQPCTTPFMLNLELETGQEVKHVLGLGS